MTNVSVISFSQCNVNRVRDGEEEEEKYRDLKNGYK